MSDELTLMYITVPHKTTGTEIARQLLTKKLIACANILPAHTSLYEWQEEIKEESEHIMLLKTQKHLVKPVQNMIESLHPYDCPCIIHIQSVEANVEFKRWVLQQTQTIP